MKTKLIAVISWIGFLVSAISEYNFDLDFPLAPSLWLAVAAFAFFAATAHNVSYGSAARSTVGVRALQPDWNCRAGCRESVLAASRGLGLPDGLPAVRVSNSSAHRHATVEKSVVAGFSLRAPIKGAATVSVLGTATDAIPALIFLCPPVTRGPPSNDHQIDGTLDRPARQFCAAPLPYETHFPGSSPLTINTTNGEPA